MISGNSESVRTAAGACDTEAGELETAADSLKQAPGLAPTWTGDAAAAFETTAGERGGDVLTLSQIYEVASRLLEDYANELDAAKSRDEDYRAAISEAEAKNTPPEEFDRDAWQQAIEDNESNFTSFGDSVAAELRALIPSMPRTGSGGAPMTPGEMLEREDFIDTMQEEFGFDRESASAMFDVWEGIEQKYPDASEEYRSWLFTRIIGGISYNGFKWDETAGPIPDDFASDDLVGILQELGLSEDQTRKLVIDVVMQHDISGSGQDLINLDTNSSKEIVDQYKNFRTTIEEILGPISDEEFVQAWDANSRTMQVNDSGHRQADFSHQMITTAANLVDSGLIPQGLWLGAAQTPTMQDSSAEYIREAAGWRGDATGVADLPSLGPDDYKADLDSVNIANRLQGGGDFVGSFNSYYDDIESGSVNRAEQFLINLDYRNDQNTVQDGYDYVQHEILTSEVPLESDLLLRSGEGGAMALFWRNLFGGRDQTTEERLDTLGERTPDSVDFLNALQNGATTLD